MIPLLWILSLIATAIVFFIVGAAMGTAAAHADNANDLH